MAIDLSPAWNRLRPARERPRLDVRTEGELTALERDVLDFEARHWPRGGAKLAAIRQTFGWSETRHNQVLRSLLDRPAALEHAPQLVNRLRAQLHRRR